MQTKIIGTILALSSILAGCATIVSSSSQEMTFQSSPEGALVKVDGNELGRTPLTIKVVKKPNQTLTFVKEGYKPYSVPMTTKIDGWMWGNILFGGFFGTTTDSVTGAIHEYAPGEYIVTLEPEALSKFGTDSKLSARENARRFIYLNYQNLQADLSKDSGEALNSVLYLLKVSDNEKSLVIAELKEMILAPKSPSDFVDLVIKKYLG